MAKTGGWYRESQRHALASKGIKTGRKDSKSNARRAVNMSDIEYEKTVNDATFDFMEMERRERVARAMRDEAETLENHVRAIEEQAFYGSLDYEAMSNERSYQMARARMYKGAWMLLMSGRSREEVVAEMERQIDMADRDIWKNEKTELELGRDETKLLKWDARGRKAGAEKVIDKL